MKNEKQNAALSSVFAAVFLTAMKVVVGIFTGSLGILSEAAHSALDLCAAVITFFAVKFADKPADGKHHYGHGKIESFSALVETLLLLATCGWIIYEAAQKVFFGKGTEIIGSQWGIAIMVISIIVDYSRAKMLKKAAAKHGSQALEADALHFSSDVWSSLVVIGGLACVWSGKIFKIPALSYADPLAALGVSVLVIIVSIKLGKRTIDVLLDAAPQGMKELVLNAVKGIDGVLQVADIRVRPSGPVYFININAGINRNASQRTVYSLVNEIREKVQQKIPTGDIAISTFPVDVVGTSEGEIYQAMMGILDQFPNCINVHNIHIYELADRRNIAAHIEVKENMTLQEAHELSHQISNLIQNAIAGIDSVNIDFQCANHKVRAEDITESEQATVEDIRDLVNHVEETVNCHDIRLYRQDNRFTTFLHCGLSGNLTVEELESLSNRLIRVLKSNIKRLESVHIHFEPAEEIGLEPSI